MTKTSISKELRDLTLCPDCYTKQKQPKKYLDECDRDGCESFITRTKKSRTLYWFNPNWG